MLSDPWLDIAFLRDAVQETLLWLQLNLTEEERMLLLGLQTHLADLERIRMRQIGGRTSPDDEKEWDRVLNEALAHLKKAREVRGGFVGKTLSRLAQRLAGPSVNPNASASAGEPNALPANSVKRFAEGAKTIRPGYQEFPKMVYYPACRPDHTNNKIVRDADEQRALGPEWFERPEYAWVAFESKARPEQLDILSRSRNPAGAIDHYYGKLFESAPGKEKLQVVQEYRDDYPHWAVNSEWAKPYLAHLPPVAASQLKAPAHGNQAEMAVASTKKPGKKYPKGFDGLRQKYADMTEYLAQVRLTQKQLECFSLRKEYNLPLSEVAGRLGIDRKTAYEHAHQAEKKIQLQLGKRRDHSGRIKKAPITD